MVILRNTSTSQRFWLKSRFASSSHVIKLKSVVISTGISFFEPSEVLTSAVAVSKEVNSQSKMFVVIRDRFKEVEISFVVVTSNLTFPSMGSTTTTTDLLSRGKSKAKKSERYILQIGNDVVTVN